MDGVTLYHPGDTGLFYDMKLIGEMNPVDVVALPIGDNFTMGIEDAVKAVESIRPKLAISMHDKTFEVIDVDPEEFVRRARASRTGNAWDAGGPGGTRRPCRRVTFRGPPCAGGAHGTAPRTFASGLGRSSAVGPQRSAAY